MAWTHGFHNSVNGDRAYNAAQMSGIFEGLITAGVYQAVGNKLAVQPNNGMTIQIATGRGWFNERWVNNSSPYLITLEASDVTLNRYAAICVRGDNSTGVRTTEPYVKYSDYATNPVKPAMTRDTDIKEYCLAYVLIRAGATAIAAADIEDTRQDANLCGWVTGLIDQITPDTLYSQFTAQFNTWFNGLVDTLDENTEAMLVDAMPKSLAVTLATSDWQTDAAGGYTCNKSIVDMTATRTVLATAGGTTEQVDAYQSANVTVKAQASGTVSFKADSVPTANVVCNFTYFGR